MVAPAGLEPARPNGQKILSLRCLPFHQGALMFVRLAWPTLISYVHQACFTIKSKNQSSTSFTSFTR